MRRRGGGSEGFGVVPPECGFLWVPPRGFSTLALMSSTELGPWNDWGMWSFKADQRLRRSRSSDPRAPTYFLHPTISSIPFFFYLLLGEAPSLNPMLDNLGRLYSQNARPSLSVLERLLTCPDPSHVGCTLPHRYASLGNAAINRSQEIWVSWLVRIPMLPIVGCVPWDITSSLCLLSSNKARACFLRLWALNPFELFMSACDTPGTMCLLHPPHPKARVPRYRWTSGYWYRSHTART